MRPLDLSGLFFRCAYYLNMELQLLRNEQNIYELRYNDIVLAQAVELSEVMGKAEKYAKKFRKKLFIAQSALADWYIGFLPDKEQNPVVFYDPFFAVKAQLESDQEPLYRFIEGPFVNQEEAVEAAFKISGKQAVLFEK
jgi:hypothetical protein